jgi:tRNA-splicing endonuclease subunit Sen2
MVSTTVSRISRLASPAERDTEASPIIHDKEHLQLSPEEAFFLVFGLGALEVVNPDTGSVMPAAELLSLFRLHCYFPPRIRSADLEPDDPFLIHYAAYHHFRSLGWVPRHGIKFGVDWLLYLRGPVFNHAEFGVVIMPSYPDSWWKERGRKAPLRSWQWLHGTSRVMSHVFKSLVLVYVEVPSPVALAEAMEGGQEAGGFAAALRLYRVREIMVRRWSSNRNRG